MSGNFPQLLLVHLAPSAYVLYLQSVRLLLAQYSTKQIIIIIMNHKATDIKHYLRQARQLKIPQIIIAHKC